MINTKQNDLQEKVLGATAVEQVYNLENIKLVMLTPLLEDSCSVLIHIIDVHVSLSLSLFTYIHICIYIYVCFNQKGDISTLDGTSLKLVDKFTYLGSSVSSTKKDIDTHG